MKEFMLIFKGPPYDHFDLSPEEIQESMNKWFAWVEKLKQQEKYISGEALQVPAKMVSGTDQVVTDGPFVEAKELVGGYFVVKAADFDEAVEISRDFPDFNLEGSVEIREVMKF